MRHELVELAKVGTIGTGGALAGLSLSQVSVIVSIGVGCITFLYVGAKLYFLIKSGGKSGG